MARPKRRQPYNPAAHDRTATDLGRGAQIYVVEVDDPYEAGGKILAARSRRDDPLAEMHFRRQIDEAQYEAGLAFQRDFEAAERGPRAIDPSKEFVDGGMMPEPITEAQRRAALQLKKVYRELGPDGSSLMHDVLIHRQTYRQIAESRGFAGQRWERYFGTAVFLNLHTLAFVYGLAKERTGQKRIAVE
jgi:hypothetical protein